MERECEHVSGISDIATDSRQTFAIPHPQRNLARRAGQHFMILYSLKIRDYVHTVQPTLRAIEKFLGILEFVIKEPGTSFRKFVPSTLSLCINDIYPLVASVSSGYHSMETYYLEIAHFLCSSNNTI